MVTRQGSDAHMHFDLLTAPRAAVLTLMACVGLAGGCDTFSSLLGSNITSVEFYNDSPYEVYVEYVTHDDQNTPESLLDDVGVVDDFELDSGRERYVEDDCDEIQAVQVIEAYLTDDDDVGASTDVLRDGDDFGCGDRILITFTTDDDGDDLFIDVDVVERRPIIEIVR